jgi:DNA-binding transcriptional MerR regulator
MDAQPSARLLSIGEFAAATQLSPKALRLYDEQRILCPAVVEATNGYRYYRADQIALGRLIRTLREMDLPLTRIQELIVVSDSKRSETLLRQFADENERRIARHRSAYQSALALLRSPSTSSVPAITERERPDGTIAVHPFMAERRSLVSQFKSELKHAYAALADASLSAVGEPFCALIDPLSDDEGRAEVAIPVVAPANIPTGIALRHLPARRSAVLGMDAGTADLAAGTDSLFDWFDRHGYHAAESPIVYFRGDAPQVELSWAFEPAFVSAPSR